MRKIVLIGFVALILCALEFGYSYAMKCPKCLEDRAKRKDRMVSIGIAHRDFETSIKLKNGNAYAAYRCCYGHVFLVQLNEEKKK
jgi:hypothetical protein